MESLLAVIDIDGLRYHFDSRQRKLLVAGLVVNYGISNTNVLEIP